jgi:hypothetical protein
MGEIVNLRGARKAAKRAEAAVKADANRVRFGRTKAQKSADAADRDRAQRVLDGARREP